MRDCEYYRKMISDRLDGEVAAEQQAELERHLEECADCRGFANEAVRLSRTAGWLPPAATEMPLVMEPVRDKGRGGWWRRRIILPVPALAASLLLIAAAWWYSLWEPSAPEQTTPPAAMEYTQVVQCRPAVAVIVAGEDEKPPAGKEEL